MWPYGVYTNKPEYESGGCWFYHDKWINVDYCLLTIENRTDNDETPTEEDRDTLAIPLEFC